MIPIRENITPFDCDEAARAARGRGETALAKAYDDLKHTLELSGRAYARPGDPVTETRSLDIATAAAGRRAIDDMKGRLAQVDARLDRLDDHEPARHTNGVKGWVHEVDQLIRRRVYILAQLAFLEAKAVGEGPPLFTPPIVDESAIAAETVRAGGRAYGETLLAVVLPALRGQAGREKEELARIRRDLEASARSYADLEHGVDLAKLEARARELVPAERAALDAIAARESALSAFEAGFPARMAAAVADSGGAAQVAVDLAEAKALDDVLHADDPEERRLLAELAAAEIEARKLAGVGSDRGRAAAAIAEKKAELTKAIAAHGKKKKKAALASVEATVAEAERGDVGAWRVLYAAATKSPAVFADGTAGRLLAAAVEALNDAGAATIVATIEGT